MQTYTLLMQTYAPMYTNTAPREPTRNQCAVSRDLAGLCERHFTVYGPMALLYAIYRDQSTQYHPQLNIKILPQPN